jgi:hypothetical protein
MALRELTLALTTAGDEGAPAPGGGAGPMASRVRASVHRRGAEDPGPAKDFRRRRARRPPPVGQP